MTSDELADYGQRVLAVMPVKGPTVLNALIRDRKAGDERRLEGDPAQPASRRPLRFRGSARLLQRDHPSNALKTSGVAGIASIDVVRDPPEA
jgi:hypothetical protein